MKRLHGSNFFSAKRQPANSTALLLQSLLASHGDDYFVGWIGDKGRDRFNAIKAVQRFPNGTIKPEGDQGVQKVAIEFAKSPTLHNFGDNLGINFTNPIHFTDFTLFRSLFDAVRANIGQREQNEALQHYGLRASQISKILNLIWNKMAI